MKRYSIALLIWCLVSSVVMARDTMLDSINAIKKNAAYLYGEATMPTMDFAVNVASDLLQAEILNWFKEYAVATDNATTAVPVDTISGRCDNMYRVFLYVKKNRLFQSGLDSLSSESPTTSPPSPDQADSLVSPQVLQTIKSRLLRKNNDALERIRGARDFFEIKKDIMPRLKEEGLVADYGRYAYGEAAQSDCYLIIYDQAYNVKAVLRKSDDLFTNLKTSQPDLLDNYHGCGAIWFTLKN